MDIRTLTQIPDWITTDALPVSIQIFEVGGSSLMNVHMFLCAFSENGDAFGLQGTRVAKRVGNGAAALVGAASLITTQKDLGAATWGASLTLDVDNNMVITVTGEAGKTIHWGLAGTITQLSI